MRRRTYRAIARSVARRDMSKTRVVNIYKEPYDVYVGRAGKGENGKFGNPYSSDDREKDLALFREYFYNRLKTDSEFTHLIRKLRGKRLGCFCKPKKCHGDIIVEYLGSIDKPMKYAVVGSREFNDYEYLQSILKWYEASHIISGGARGADALARRYARENNIQLKEFFPNWDNGKKAGFLRNHQIVEAADMVIAFWDKKSPGTRHTLQLAEEMGKEILIFWKVPKLPEDILENFGN